MKRFILALALAILAAFTPFGGSVLAPTSVVPGSALPAVQVQGILKGLLMSDSKDGSPILTGANMKPGSSVSGTVKISVTALLEVSISETNITHAGPAGSGNFAHRLQLTIFDQTNGHTIYSGALDSMPSNTKVCGGFLLPPNCPRWGVLESHTFLFTVTFPNAPNNSDNAYKGTSASVTFVWNGALV